MLDVDVDVQCTLCVCVLLCSVSMPTCIALTGCVLLCFGVCARGVRRHLEAAHCFRSTSMLSLADPAPALSNHAIACVHLGFEEDATQIFGAAVALQPNCTTALEGLSYLARHVRGPASAAARSILVQQQQQAGSMDAHEASLAAVLPPPPPLAPLLLQPVYWMD